MNRKELLHTLDLVAPALATDNIMEIFQYLCFNNGTVHAYKETFGITAPVDVDVDFVVYGKTFMELLRASNAKELEIILESENVLLKAGKSKIKLPYRPVTDFLFEEPSKEKWDFIIEIESDLLNGIELCLVTSSKDATMLAFNGISISSDGHKIHFYSADADAISRYHLADEEMKKKTHLMPNDFCEALLKIATKAGMGGGQLYVNKDWAVAELSSGYRIFGRIMDVPDPTDYEHHIGRVMKKTSEWITIPGGLAQALNRARIIGENENKSTVIKFDGRKMFLATDSHMGLVKDTIAFKGDHPSLEAMVNAKNMSRAIGVTDEFSMQEDCTAYRHGEDFLLVMSNLAE